MCTIPHSMERPERFYSAGIRLAADLHVPDDLAPGERRAGIVLCHGFGAIKAFTLPDLARSYVEAGYVVLRFDHRGFGESGGTRWRLMPLEQVEDIRNAITFLGLQPEVDADRIGLHGGSFGGANAVYAAALDDRAKCVVATVAVGNGERWLRSLRPNWQWILLQRRIRADRDRRVRTGDSEMVSPDEVMPPDPETEDRHRETLRAFPEREFRLSLESAEAVLEYRPEDVADRIAPRPVLFIQVEDDGLVANDISRELFDRARQPKELVVLRGMMHHSIAAGAPYRQMMGHALPWFGRHLPARAPVEGVREPGSEPVRS